MDGQAERLTEHPQSHVATMTYKKIPSVSPRCNFASTASNDNAVPDNKMLTYGALIPKGHMSTTVNV